MRTVLQPDAKNSGQSHAGNTRAVAPQWLNLVNAYQAKVRQLGHAGIVATALLALAVPATAQGQPASGKASVKGSLGKDGANGSAKASKTKSKPATGNANGQGEAKGKASAKGKGKTAAKDGKGKTAVKDIVPADPELAQLQRRLQSVAAMVKTASDIAGKQQAQNTEFLAQRLTLGQLLLQEHAGERAAILFLDILENYPDTVAAVQARFYLGEALLQLDMPEWAVECFAEMLRSTKASAKRLQQKSIAHLLDLSYPRRERGFARNPGVSATPELRARLRSLGLPTVMPPPKGAMSPDNARKLVGWVKSIASDEREPVLHYAYGRYLYMTGSFKAAVEELDVLAPKARPAAKVDELLAARAAYLAAASALSLGEFEDALVRFSNLTQQRVKGLEARRIVELAWMAIGRVLHDLGDYERAMAAYRQIGRASPMYLEASYELAWTLLRSDRLGSLDTVLLLPNAGPIASELKLLRGKIKIRQRDWKAAEAEFETLREEFRKSAESLGQSLTVGEDATSYFTAVMVHERDTFSLGSLLPQGAVSIARGLPRTRQAEVLARDVGALQRELAETEDLLARLTEVMQSRDRARLFTDLGAQRSSLDRADEELLEVGEKLINDRARNGSVKARLQGARIKLKDAIGGAAQNRGRRQRADQVENLRMQIIELDAETMAVRAKLVGAERSQRAATRAGKAGDAKTFFTEAAALRQAVGQHERALALLRSKLAQAETGMRVAEVGRKTRLQAVDRHWLFLTKVRDGLKTKPSADNERLWKRMLKLRGQLRLVRKQIDDAAEQRLQRAAIVLAEERRNVTSLRQQLDGLQGRAEPLLGDVLTASMRDVSAELEHWIVRSEVGLLDVVWAKKRIETDEVRRLEARRDRRARAIDRSVKEVLSPGRPQ